MKNKNWIPCYRDSKTKKTPYENYERWKILKDLNVCTPRQKKFRANKYLEKNDQK